MNKLVFSSDQLPQDLDDQARFAAWRDMYLGTICHFDVERLTDQPFSTQYQFLKVGDISLATCEGTIHRFKRTAHHLAADTRDDFFVSINGDRPWALQARGRSHEFVPNSFSFLSTTEPGQADHAGGATWQGLVLPSSRVHELVRNPDDLAGRPIDANSEVARHVRRYIEMLFASDGLQDPALLTLVETTLADLVALLLNGRRDATELATMRGLRAARLRGILGEIRQGFSRGDFSPRKVAARLGLSVNYIQKILFDTGVTFSERVLDLRLQKGRAMLANPRNDGMKVSDIALACGFNEVSYFNRCFRRRFGASPTQFRGRG